MSSLDEDEDDFEMFDTEDFRFMGKKTFGNQVDDEDEDDGVVGGSTSTNKLKFYPYSNNKLTRSTGTLNLSLSNTALSESTSKFLGKIEEEEEEEDHNHDDEDDEEEEEEEETMDSRINRWSPFNETDNVATPTVKRSMDRTSTPSSLGQWNQRWFTANQSRNDSIPPSSSYTVAKPNQSVFTSSGLMSKMSRDSSLYPTKLRIPETPVKKSPLVEGRDHHHIHLSNSKIASSSLSVSPLNFIDDNNLHEDLLFSDSPSSKALPSIHVSAIDSSPLSETKYHSHDRNNNHSNILSPTTSLITNNSPQTLHSNKFKKIKRARNSVILKNKELTNSLQQFKDDLYGTDENFPPPIIISSQHSIRKNSHHYQLRNPNDNDTDEEISTPTRRKSITGAKSQTHYETKPLSLSSASMPTKSNTETHSISSTDSSPLNSKRRLISSNKLSTNPDSHLFEKFTNVHSIGKGQFSTVYQVTFAQTNKKYAIKAIKPNKYNSLKRILLEIKILNEVTNQITLDQEGKEYIIDYISSWKFQNSYYIMTELCENGNLDGFLQEQVVAKKMRLEDWRIWKIIVELSLALRFIHESCHIVHLDLKPANVMITFEGNLKLGDFGMAAHLPLEDKSFENEGDREYIAPEIISDCTYDYKADIFSLGLMIVEIAANVILPDNGNAWHKLRSGDLSDAGRLSSTDIHSESLFSDTTKVDTNDIFDFERESTINNNNNTATTATTAITTAAITTATTTTTTTTTTNNNNNNNNDNNDNNNAPTGNTKNRLVLHKSSKIPAWVPKFLIDGESLERIVRWMIEPNYERRPTANQILQTEECLYVEMTRSAGAIIQEDDFGPKPKFFI
ncbi:hypothetical protein SUVZ_10G0230 [Saccharomyces uvarum]|uniref:Protein kinase domain-containing protein n=1 Tax=Saccharomyces uvarum TaxID=230603 RepID=A0ABN8WJE8_SACUV|nr:hypothetical protein SUVZ_10G0230 [Saccharomyces uvarum]